jgi:polyhydroxybutyrate depolymerase
MRARHWLALLAACTALTGSTYGQTDSFEVGGLTRSFIVHAPGGLSEPALVISMHGMEQTASAQQLYTRLDPVADREGFVVVYPNGVDNAWDVVGDRDVTFILALIDTLVARHGIDRARVYATGMSMGGFMSHRLACAASEHIAAIGPVAGLNVSGFSCTLTRPVPVMQIHGTADSLVPYSGVAATIDGWVSRNGCSGTPVVTDPYPPSDSSSATSMSYYGPCDEGSEVVLLTVEGAGHVWPGGWGATTYGIDASEELWAFFEGHALAVVDASPMPRGDAVRFAVRVRGSTLFVRCNAGIESARLLDARGRVVGEWRAGGGALEAAVPLPAACAGGVYLLRVRGRAGVSCAVLNVP